MSCIVRGCRSHSGNKENSGENISFHKFPKTEDIRRRWFAALGRSEKHHKHHWRVCSRHFNPDCFVGGNLLRARLKENTVPTLILSSNTDVALPCLSHSQQQSLGVSVLPMPPASSTMPCPSNSQQQSMGVSVLPMPPASSTMPCPSNSQQQSLGVSVLPMPPARSTMPCPSNSQQQSMGVSVLPMPPASSTMPCPSNSQQQSLGVSVLPMPPARSTMPCPSNSQQQSMGVSVLPMPPASSTMPCPSNSQQQSMGVSVLPMPPASSTMDLAETMSVSQTTLTAIYEGRISKLQKKIQKLELIAKNRLLKLNAQKQRTRRLNKKNTTINQRLIELLQKEKIDEEYLIMLKNIKSNEIIERYLSKAQGSTPKEYSSELKKFAVTLHYLSPKAYSYVREELKHILPHPNTISKWYCTLDCNPGFTKEALDAIKERVAQNKDKPLYCALSIDEMAIRKIIEWDGRHYFGYADIGCDIDSDDAPIAKEALTFMVTAMNDNWKIPVGYFLLNSITSQQKAGLVKQCLSLLRECGITVVSLTFDGAATNRAMCTHLSNNESSNSFRHEDQDICFWPDPCHNIKLIRNAFADKRDLVDDQGQKISWSHIERLNQIQKDEGIHLGTRLRDEHLNFEKQKMKVRLATQLLSQSVADALEYCQQKGISGFEDCIGTIKFIRIFNNLFDIMNSRSIHAKGWKKAANPCNIADINFFFSEAETYIKTLRFANDNSLVVHSNRSTGFRGFLTSMASLLQIYNALVEAEIYLKYICTYKMSQDHLELFFGAIRYRCGFNNNPSARMFRAAYKRLLVHAQLKDGASGNCVPLDQIPVLNASKFNNRINESTGNTRLVKESMLLSDVSLDVPDHDYCLYPSSLSEYSQDVVQYIAGFVVRKLKKNLRCEKCLQALEGSANVMPLICVKDRGGLTKPSKSIQKICLIAEKILREFEAVVTKKSVGKPQYFSAMINRISQRLLLTNVLEELHEHSLDNSVFDDHRNLLLKSVSETYLKIRIHHMTKQITAPLQKIRSFLTKTIIFKGQ